MARKRLKRGNGKEERCNPDPVVNVDRISTLPDPVLHHILSFVPTVFVVRMSVLSRRWRRVWLSVPTLHFSYFGGSGFKHAGAFNLFVEKCMKYRRGVMRFIADSSVASFKLHMYSSPDRFPGLNKWFHSSTIMNNVKELDLRLLEQYAVNGSYELPSAILNGRRLTHLKLGDDVHISSSCSVNLPSLTCLCLSNVEIDGKILYNLVLGCPSLVKCVLTDAICIGPFRISSLSLNFLEVGIEDEIVAAKIDAVNLQNLVIRDFGLPSNFNSLTGIKDLSIHNLSCVIIKNFEDEIPKLTLLENLTLKTLDEYYGNEMRIENCNVKNITLEKGFDGDFNLTIVSWSLISFNYKGDTDLSLTMRKSNVKGVFSIRRGTADNGWYSELLTFLANINWHWTSIYLYVYEDKDLIVPKDLRTGNPPWPDIKHLTVTSQTASKRKVEFRKALKWLCPSLVTLNIETNPDYSLYA